MITSENFTKAINEYTSIYNDKTWDGHLKREYPAPAIEALYNVYCEKFQEGFFSKEDDANHVAVYIVDVWAFVKNAKLTEMCKDGFASNNEKYSVNEMKNELYQNNALFSCKGGYIINLEVFEEYFPRYESYSGESLVTQTDYLH